MSFLSSSKRLLVSCLVLCVCMPFAGCQNKAAIEKKAAIEQQRQAILGIYAKHEIPSLTFSDEMVEQFITELELLIATDKDNLLLLADKSHFLDASYEPNDLIELTANDLFSVNKAGMSLRLPAYNALLAMAEGAQNEGLKLLVSSAYRSYDYQERVYNWNVSTFGQEAADRESARPGSSQHQLGTVIDFGSITNDFAQTPEGIWVFENAANYGFSLSYPQGYEPITGYMWESWHYRYIGKDAVAFQKKWFNNIQQYMMEFIYEWNRI